METYDPEKEPNPAEWLEMEEDEPSSGLRPITGG
jgi:hypothetical protein